MPKIGHRGAAGYEVENTKRSIKKALELRVDMVELDVRRCASGELVVFHDARVDRITYGHGAIKKMTLAEIKNLRTWDEQQILTLPEALDFIGGRCWVNLDIKCQGVAGQLVEIIHNSVATKKWRLRQFLISSFNHRELLRIKTLEKELKIGLLYNRWVRSVLRRATRMSAYSVHFNFNYIKRTTVELLRDRGIKSFVWTVNDETSARRAYSLGVDGIISDYPDII